MSDGREKIVGANVFGGGREILDSSRKIIGAVGVSGDTSVPATSSPGPWAGVSKRPIPINE